MIVIGRETAKSLYTPVAEIWSSFIHEDDLGIVWNLFRKIWMFKNILVEFCQQFLEVQLVHSVHSITSFLTQTWRDKHASFAGCLVAP